MLKQRYLLLIYRQLISNIEFCSDENLCLIFQVVDGVLGRIDSIFINSFSDSIH